MQRLVGLVGTFSLVMVLLASCGTTFQPRVGTSGVERPPGSPPTESPGPAPSPTFGGDRDGRSIVETTCRAQGVPSGWIAVGYTAAGGDGCPKGTGLEEQYPVAIIERYGQKPVGSIMAVCADQPVPRDWRREWSREASAGCAGARVAEGRPTAFIIRRVR